MQGMKRLLLILLVLGLPAFCQAPDIQASQTFTSPAAGTPISVQGTTGAASWRLSFRPTGFTGAHVQVESAEDCAGSPCAIWTAIAAANFIEGTNPIVWSATSTPPDSQTSAFRFVHPWLRVNVTAATGAGSIVTLLLGYRGTSPALPFPSGGGTGSNINVQDWGGTAVTTCGVAGCPGVGGVDAAGSAPSGNPVQSAGVDDNGNLRPLATDASGDLTSMCDNPALVQQIYAPLTTLGLQTIVAGTASKKIRFCHRYFSTGTPESIAWVDGTGTNCGTTATTIDQQTAIMGAALDDLGSLVIAAGHNFCVNLSASQPSYLTATYVVF